MLGERGGCSGDLRQLELGHRVQLWTFQWQANQKL